MQKLSNYDRDKAIYRYVTALDHGDLDCVAEILELALWDSELERIIEEIDLTYQEEEGITAIATDVAIVRDLIQQHLHSAFEEVSHNQSNLMTDEAINEPLTVGDVARRLQQTKSFNPTESRFLADLLNSCVLIPSPPSFKAIEELFKKDLKLNVNRRFIDTFRQVAIKLGMGRSYNNAQLAAARQHKRNYKSTNK
ncbi:MAG: hypothetical protein ACRC80_10920 [Waterburya sp.]